MDAHTLEFCEASFCYPETRARLTAIIHAIELGWWSEAKYLINDQARFIYRATGKHLDLDYRDLGEEIEVQFKGWLYRLHQIRQRLQELPVEQQAAAA